MKEFLNVFKINQNISKRVASELVLIQVIFFFLFWYVTPTGIIPKPHEIFSAFGDLWNEGIAVDLKTSFVLNVQALLITSVLSMFLSYLTTIPFFRPIVAVLTKLRFLSLVGLTVVFTLLSTGSHSLKLLLLVFGMSVFFLTSMGEVSAATKEELDYARTLRMGELHVVWEVVILGKMDKAIEVMRDNAAMGWMMLTMVEGLARSEGGIGVLLLNQNKHFHLDAVFAIQFSVIFLGLGQDYAIGWIKDLLCPYAKLEMERR